jgi:hypothetical protein
VSAVLSVAAAAPDASAFQGSAGVFAVVLLEVAVGALALLWLTPVWGVVKRGFFVLIGSTVAVCALLSLLSARSGLSRSGGRTSSARLALLLFAALSAAFLGALIAKRVGVARVVGLVALAVGLWAIVAIALLRGSGAPAVKGAVAMLCGAAFLGATWNGMILGHWYLVDRKLRVDPMKAASLLFSISVGLGVVSALVGRGHRPTSKAAFQTSALLLVSNLELYLAIGLVAVCALLAFFTHKLVHEGSIRAATGMLYLAVIMAFSAEFAAKVYFFST